MEAIGRQFEPVGPSERAAFDEGTSEIGGVGKRARYDGVACYEISRRPERLSGIREYELRTLSLTKVRWTSLIIEVGNVG